MEKKNMKKLLASLGIASLISAGSMGHPGAASGSGWAGVKSSAGGADQNVETSADTTEEVKKKSDESDETDDKDSAGSADEEEKKPEKETGGSGWAGSK